MSAAQTGGGYDGPRVEFRAQPALRMDAKHSFRTGWRWSKGITKWFILETSRLDLKRPILHLCSGSSRLGDVRVDAFHEMANVRASMYKLPFKTGAFPTVICDPPYELPLQDRAKLNDELARVTAWGGRLLWKAPWVPGEGYFEIHDVTVVSNRTGLMRNAHLLVRARRRENGPGGKP